MLGSLATRFLVNRSPALQLVSILIERSLRKIRNEINDMPRVAPISGWKELHPSDAKPEMLQLEMRNRTDFGMDSTEQSDSNSED